MIQCVVETSGQCDWYMKYFATGFVCRLLEAGSGSLSVFYNISILMDICLYRAFLDSNCWSPCVLSEALGCTTFQDYFLLHSIVREREEAMRTLVVDRIICLMKREASNISGVDIGYWRLFVSPNIWKGNLAFPKQMGTPHELHKLWNQVDLNCQQIPVIFSLFVISPRIISIHNSLSATKNICQAMGILTEIG